MCRYLNFLLLPIPKNSVNNNSDFLTRALESLVFAEHAEGGPLLPGGETVSINTG